MPEHDPAGFVALSDCDWSTPFHLRPDEYRDARSEVTEGMWRAAQKRRLAGDAMEDIAATLKLSENRTAIGLRERFGLKRDYPDAVHRPRGRAALPASPRDMVVRPELALPLDMDDPVWSRDLLKNEIGAAFRRGALGQATAWMRALGELERAPWKGLRADGTAETPAEVAAIDEGEVEAVVLHDHQKPPTAADDGGDWSTWVLLGGRGAGKTLAGASWLAGVAEDLGEGGRVAIVGATLHDAREVMIEGPSGILGLSKWAEIGARPVHVASRRRVVFPGGCVGMVFSAEDADSLRGPQFHAGWADEFCAWSGSGGDRDVLAMVRLGLRLGPCPRLCVTTTPRPTRALRALLKEPGVAVARAATRDNEAHLSPGFVEGLERLYGGTRLAAQEIEGQVVDDGRSLWTAETIARTLMSPPPRFELTVVGVDPTTTADGDACGIVVVGRARGADGVTRAHVMADWTVRGQTPEGWSRRVADAVVAYKADRVVAEVNQGGDMVTSVLKTQGKLTVPVVTVRATRSKAARAEPVAALYEQGRVKHSGEGLKALEEELMAMGPEEGSGSLDRADALVWAVTALMVDEMPAGEARVRRLT